MKMNLHNRTLLLAALAREVRGGLDRLWEGEEKTEWVERAVNEWFGRLAREVGVEIPPPYPEIVTQELQMVDEFLAKARKETAATEQEIIRKD